MLHRWIIHTIIKREGKYINISSHCKSEDIEKESIEYLKQCFEHIKANLPDSFVVLERDLWRGLAKEIGLYYFFSEKWEMAQKYLEHVKDMDSVASHVKICNSILGGHDNIASLSNAIVKNLGGDISQLSAHLIDLLVKDNFELKIPLERRKHCEREFCTVKDLGIKILACNYICEVVRGHVSRQYSMYRCNHEFLVQLCVFTQRMYDMNGKFDPTLRHHVMKVLEDVDDVKLFEFVRQNAKVVYSEKFRREIDGSKMKSIVEKTLGDDIVSNSLLLSQHIVDQNLFKRFKDSHASFLLVSAKRFYYLEDYVKCREILHQLEQCPIQSKVIISDVRYLRTIVEMQEDSQVQKCYELLFTYIDQKDFPDLDTKVEIFKTLMDKGLWGSIKRYFECLQSDTVTSFFMGYTYLNDRDSTDMDQFTTFTKYFEVDATRDFYKYISNTKNLVHLLRFTSLITYILFTVRMTNKVEHDRLIHLKGIASVYLADDLLIAPPPNPVWSDKSSEEILVNILKSCLERIVKEKTLPQNRIFLKQPDLILYCAMYSDLLFESEEYKKSLSILIPRLELSNLTDPIIRRLVFCFVRLRKYTCAAVLQQFLPTYDHSVVSLIKVVDKYWMSSFFQIPYLEILMYHCTSDRDHLIRLIERPELGPNHQHYKSTISEMKSTILDKLKL